MAAVWRRSWKRIGRTFAVGQSFIPQRGQGRRSPSGLALAVRLSSAFAAAAGVDPVVDEAGARECVHNFLRVSFLGAHSSVRAGAASPRGPTHGQVPQLIYRLALA